MGHGRDHRRLPDREVPLLLGELELAFRPAMMRSMSAAVTSPTNRNTSPRPTHSVERWGRLRSATGHSGPAKSVATADATNAPR